MPLCIVEERQQRRRPLAAAPLRAAVPLGCVPQAALLAPYIPPRVCSSLASYQRELRPAALGVCSKVQMSFCDGPYDAKTRRVTGISLRLRVFAVIFFKYHR